MENLMNPDTPIEKTAEAAKSLLMETLSLLGKTFEVKAIQLVGDNGFEWTIVFDGKEIMGRSPWGEAGKVRLSIMAALSIGLHPMGQYVTYFFEALRWNGTFKNKVQNYGVDFSPLQLVLRMELARFFEQGVPRKDFEISALKLMNLEGNIRMLFAEQIHYQKDHKH